MHVAAEMLVVGLKRQRDVRFNSVQFSSPGLMWC